MQPRRNKLGQRRGNAAVELAVTVPLMATIVFGSIELCSMVHNKQALATAAYECTGVAISATGTDAEVQSRATDILDQLGIVGGSVTTTPASIEGIPRGTQITVTVSAPVAGNSLVTMPNYGPENLEARCVMLKEL